MVTWDLNYIYVSVISQVVSVSDGSVVLENMDSLASQIIRFIHLHLIASVLLSRWSSHFFTAFLQGVAVSTDDSIFLSPTW